MTANSNVDRSSLQIMVVDDTLGSLKLLTDILNRAGYLVRPASNGRLALRSAAVKAPDLILLDIKMEEMDGYEVCRRLKAESACRDVPVIFISSLHSVQSKVKGFEAGGIDYLHKPFQAEEVLARVNIHLELRQLQKQLEARVRSRTADLEQANRALHLSEQKFKRIFEEMQNGYFKATTDGVIEMINPSALEALGYADAGEILGRKAAEEISAHPKEWTELKDLLVDKGRINGHEMLFKHKNGVLVQVEVNAQLISAADHLAAAMECIFQDITDRKEVENKLKEAHADIRQIFDNAMVGIYRTMPSGEVTLVNPASLRILKLESLESLNDIGMLNLYVDASDPERLMNLLQQGPVTEYETQLYRSDGQIIDILLTAYSALGDDGELRFIEGNLTDITGRKRMQAELREKEKLLRNVFESMQEGVLVLDRDYKYTSWNRSMEKIFHTPREAVLGALPWDKFPFIKGDIEIKIQGAMQGEVHRDLESQYRLPDGKLGWTSASYFPLMDSEGQIDGVVGVVEEISDQKLIDDELRSLRHYLSSIIDSMPSALIGVDIEGRVTQWNKTAEKRTGIPVHDALGSPLTAMLPRMAADMKKIEDSIRSGQIMLERKQSHSREGELRYEDVTIFPLDANGVEGVVIRIDDVTETVRMEEMIVQSEKMLSVGGLAAGMAHEINNPLAGIMQTANVMANRLGANLHIPANRKAAEAAGTTMAAIESYMQARGIPGMIDEIRRSGQRMGETVANMLRFARKSDATVTAHVLGTLIDETVELAGTDYDLKKGCDFKLIEIVKDYAADLPSVSCEGAKIQQVLLNILRNGAQAMQEAQIQAPRFIIRTRLEAKSRMACIEIEDNGPGMDEATRRRVFEPFFTTKPAGIGTGLGLSVSYFIVTENHGGELTVESRPGFGTIFTIRLHIDEEKRARATQNQQVVSIRPR